MNPRNSRFVRGLIISYSAVLLVILIMGAYLYTISIDNASKEIIAQNRFTLKKTVNDMEKALKTMDMMASQVVTNSDIVHLANSEHNTENIFYLQAFHAKEAMTVYGFTESILPIKTYYIYLKQPGYILNASQFAETELYYNGNYYQDYYDEWFSILDSDENFRHFIPVDPYKTFSDNTYLYKLPLTQYTIKNVPASICYEIDYVRLMHIFQELNFYDSGYLYVTDEAGNQVFSIKGESTETVDVIPLTEQDRAAGFSIFKSFGKEMHITNTLSTYNGWQYYLVQPADKALYSLNRYRNIFILIILIALLVELVMIFFLSRTNVKKITQLGNELQDTLSVQKTLQKAVETQKPLIMQSYLSKILKGNIATQQELYYAQQYLDIQTTEKKFTILYMIIYVNQYELYVENSAITVPKDTNNKEIVQDALDRYFKEQAYVFSSKEGEYAILLSSDEHEEQNLSTEAVKNAFYNCHEHLITNYSIWTFAGLGNWHTGLMLTWKSYQQATEAINYATKRHIFHNYAGMDKDSSGFYYPLELTKQLNTFITSGNESQVLEIFEIIRHENMEERSLPINMMKYLLSDVRNTLFKLRFTIKDTVDNREDLQAIDALFSQHMSLKLYEDLAVNLCQLFKSNVSNNKQIATIKTYIDQCFKDPSLCLTKISDEFSISESYFSYLFKVEIGENFSSYLEHIRIEQAYELLKNSDINVSNIYQQVGYNSPHTFRRAFKKVYGMSPKQARLQSRNA